MLENSELYKAYRDMKLIREFEERIRAEYQQGKLPGFIHMYRAQEAIAVAMCMNLTDQDYIASTHRGHGHCIALARKSRALDALRNALDARAELLGVEVDGLGGLAAA